MIIVRVGFARLAVTFSLRDYTVAPRGVFGSSESGLAITENVSEVFEILREKRPQNVPQLYANQALHADSLGEITQNRCTKCCLHSSCRAFSSKVPQCHDKT